MFWSVTPWSSKTCSNLATECAKFSLRATPPKCRPITARPSRVNSTTQEPEFYGLFDDNTTSGRMLAIANFNNDIGDYWEWSAEGLYGDAGTTDAYRLGVDYLIYAMTH